ncbi:MAG TPA: bacillithiol biosynthesis cysteine-adding enzyme BshC [Pyrinomonadaceae bacterium]|nr:bacillithiol biosynthesis cysteine-adding enzyme BshC [Pyrinomonadaceae bacterium]
MPEIDCLPSTTETKLPFDRISFSDIPSQSRLFTDYQTDPVKLAGYYPNAVSSHTEVAERAGEVLAKYATDRNRLCDALEDQNRNFGAGARTFENIELLRRKRTVAVLTGQQAGLFTGPLYTIYKALSAIRMAECLRNRGIDAVPVFWAATEDHDFDEIASASILADGGAELKVRIEVEDDMIGRPVGGIEVPAAFAQTIDEALSALPATAFSADVGNGLRETWRPGRTIGEAFCRDIQRLFAAYGLIVVDPMDGRIKKLAAPIYAEAAGKSTEILEALLQRTKELAADGYHSQVLVTPDYFPLFYHDAAGVRRSLRREGDRFHVAGTREILTLNDIARLALDDPERLSPGVMLRSVVQDFLFPTVCYFGGGAEVAYFAQNSEVYRILERPVTTILHRQSFTIVDSKHRRILQKYEMTLRNLFDGFEAVLPSVVDRFVNPKTARLFADAEEGIKSELHRLDEELSRIDPTLAANLATRRRKILYHLAALQKKFRRVQVERDEIVNRQLRSLFAWLWPHGGLQERTLNVSSFLTRYGDSFLPSVYSSTDLDERGHRILFLS